MFNYSDTGVDSLLSLSPRTAIIFEIIHVRKLLVVFEFVVFHRRKQYQRQRVFEFERISTSNTDSRSALFSCVIAHPLEVVGLNTSFVTKRQVTPGVSAWWRRFYSGRKAASLKMIFVFVCRFCSLDADCFAAPLLLLMTRSLLSRALF